MKNDPCVRLGIFIRPKISENPADSRNNSPPSVMLLTASTSHRFIAVRLERRLQGAAEAPSRFQRRIITRVHRLSEEPLLVVRPELAHLRVRLDRGVDQLVALALAAPDVEAPDDVAQVIERERPARRVDERHPTQRLDERLTVVGLSARL